MKKDILIVSIIVILAIVGGVYFIINNSSSKSSSINQTNESGNSLNQTQSLVITQENLSNHNSQSDCWVAFEGKVYDITSFLPKHPGSAAAITPYCGTSKEFEDAFLAKHGRTKVKLLIQVAKIIGDFKTVGTIK